MPNFKLVNPHIIGSIESSITSKDKNSAAHETWQNISQYFTGSLPEFVFTLEGGNNKYYTFQVTESTTGKYADFAIHELDFKMSPEQIKSFKTHSERLNNSSIHNDASIGNEKSQDGGKKRYKNVGRNYDDDDDEDDSSSDSVYEKLKLFKTINHQKPIMYLWYAPLIYNLPRFYVPTFSAPLTPYVEINLSREFF